MAPLPAAAYYTRSPSTPHEEPSHATQLPQGPEPHPPAVTVADVLSMIDDAVINGTQPPDSADDCDSHDDAAFAVNDSAVDENAGVITFFCEKKVIVTKKFKATVTVEPADTP